VQFQLAVLVQAVLGLLEQAAEEQVLLVMVEMQLEQLLV
jgi:hypothetical protein